MLTYENYFGITKEGSPEKYDAIKENVDGFLYFLGGAEKGAPFDTLDLKKGAENYLRNGGLSGDQIAQIEEYICE